MKSEIDFIFDVSNSLEKITFQNIFRNAEFKRTDVNPPAYEIVAKCNVDCPHYES